MFLMFLGLLFPVDFVVVIVLFFFFITDFISFLFLFHFTRISVTLCVYINRHYVSSHISGHISMQNTYRKKKKEKKNKTAKAED